MKIRLIEPEPPGMHVDTGPWPWLNVAQHFWVVELHVAAPHAT